MRLTPTRRRRASALMATLIIIGMLLAVVVALHYYQGVSRQTYMIEEASLRFREGAKFAIRKEAIGMDPPSGLLVTGSPQDVSPSGLPGIDPKYGAKIFDRTNGLPDLRVLENSPAHRYVKITPTTPDFGLRVFGSNTYTTVLTSVPGYAAYAPGGSVNITNVEGWANPTFQDEREAMKAYSGQKALTAALKDVTLGNCTYGEAYTINGTAKVLAGDGVAFKHPKFPLRPYEAQMRQQAETVRATLQTIATNSGDKTNSMVSPTTGPAAIINLFFGGGSGLEQFLSLRNANHFWFPIIPSFSPSPPYLYQFAFSLPWPPDNASYSTGEDAEKKLNDIGKQMEEAGPKLKKAKEDLDKAQAEYNQNQNSSTLAALNAAQLEYDKWLGIVNDLNQQMQAISGPQTQEIKNQSMAGMKGVPLTRAQDPDGTEGITGWNYSKGLTLLGSLIEFMFSFDAAKLADAVSNDDVKLIHFGGKDRDYQWFLDDNHMIIDATMTVPRGRTLRLRSTGDIVIAGDLWLQRGSTFYADCNSLKVQPGRNSDPSKFFSPCGRIFLEEGATLVCRGSLVCAGSSQWGSVVVCGVPGKIHPLNAAIFAQNVQLDSGVYAGTALDDLLEGLGLNDGTLKDLNDNLIRPLISQIGPNAAKAVGPFFARNPYFAKYATTMQIICPPLPPFGEPGPPIPTPIPLPVDNVLVPIERGLAWVYSITLNMSLGENFYTHSDWWVFGEGVVPIVPQLDPLKAAAAIANFPSESLKALDPEQIIKDFVDAAVDDMVTYLVEQAIHAIVEKVALNMIPYAGLADMAGSLLTDVASNFTGREDKQKSAGSSLTSALTDAVKNSALNTLSQLANKFTTTLENEYLREYNGVFVYADDNLNIGGRNATGFFMSKNGNITVSAQHCVGALLAEKGNISCQHLLFYPYFNRASLYKPKQTANNWFDRALQFDYDSAFNSNDADDIGPPGIPSLVTAQGWQK